MNRLARVLALSMVVCAVASAAASSEPAGGAVRTLVIVLDAVPFRVVEDLISSRSGEEALFERFQPPRPIISSFPSSTSVAMVGLLEPFEVARSPGYEPRFFDWERRKARGGGAISFFQIEFEWRSFFEWSKKGVASSAFAGLRPVKVTTRRLGKAIDAFFDSDVDPFFAYFETTDLAAHLKGPRRLEEILVRLDAELEGARARHPNTDFRTVVFSDHGVAGDGSRLVNALPAVRAAVRAAGFRKSKRLRRPEDLVLTPYGLVSSFEAYTEPERVAAASAALVQAEGVDLCAYRDGDALVVEDREGRASIESRRMAGGLAWKYTPQSGDPLDYRITVGGLERRSTGRFVPDARWLEATKYHRYPDALYRISRAFDLVENPASVICSLDSGYMYGLVATERAARATGSTVRWTHGALGRDASLGLLLTDDERFASTGPVRFDRALLPLTLPRPASAAIPAAGGARGKMRQVGER